MLIVCRRSTKTANYWTFSTFPRQFNLLNATLVHKLDRKVPTECCTLAGAGRNRTSLSPSIDRWLYIQCFPIRLLHSSLSKPAASVVVFSWWQCLTESEPGGEKWTHWKGQFKDCSRHCRTGFCVGGVKWFITVKDGSGPTPQAQSQECVTVKWGSLRLQETSLRKVTSRLGTKVRI